MPFPIIIYSLIFLNLSESFLILFGTSLFSIGLIYLGSIIEARIGLSLGVKHAIFAPLGSLAIVLGFASGILDAKKNNSLTWRGRTYSLSETNQHSISL
jgi:hypothetical protein